jgi:hypothetical protein
VKRLHVLPIFVFASNSYLCTITCKTVQFFIHKMHLETLSILICIYFNYANAQESVRFIRGLALFDNFLQTNTNNFLKPYKFDYISPTQCGTDGANNVQICIKETETVRSKLTIYKKKPSLY